MTKTTKTRTEESDLTTKEKVAVEDKILQLVTRRPHSEKELIVKLLRKDFSTQEIAHGITFAHQTGLLEEPLELSKKFTQELLRKGKGRHFIRGALQQKGLPSSPISEEEELLSARKEYIKKSKQGGKNPDQLKRHLVQRGFDWTAIRSVLDEK